MAFFINDLELVSDDVAFADLEEVTHATFAEYMPILNPTAKYPIHKIQVSNDVVGGILVWVTVHYTEDTEPMLVAFNRHRFGIGEIKKEY